MKKVALIVALALGLLYSSTVYSQAPEVEWERAYGDTTWNDYGLGAFQTDDGGYILGGNSQGWDGNWQELVLFKLDTNGDSLWSAAETGTNSIDNAEQFGLMNNGTYMFVGSSDQDTADGQAYLYNADPDGSYGWTGLYGDMDPPEIATCVASCGDTAYAIMTSFWWNSEYGYDMRMRYVGMTGWESWTEHYYSIVADRAECITPRECGEFIITGTGQDPEWYHSELLLVKTTVYGFEYNWQQLGTPRDDGGEWVIETDDGGFLAVGWTTEVDEISKDVYIIKTDIDLIPEWYQTYGFTGRHDRAYHCVETEDGNFMVAATTAGLGSFDFWLLCLDTNGDTLWTKIIERDYAQIPYTVDIADDGGYLLGGNTGTIRGDNDMYVVKLGPETSVDSNSKLPSNTTLLQNYPNPFNASTTISFNIVRKQSVTIKLYDALGREVKTIYNQTCEPGYHKFNYDASSLKTGIYFYTIYTADKSETAKMVIIK